MNARVHLRFLIAALAGLLIFAVVPAVAQVGETPSLVQALTVLTDDGVYAFNQLDFAAARANDAAYASLLPICAAAIPSAACSGATLRLFDQLRDLEDTANELLGRGQVQYSLRLSPLELANALQWTAPEEYAAQGSMTSQFANNQASILANRFSALHFASMATLFAEDVDDPTSAKWAFAYRAIGAGAGADSSSASFGGVSVFFNTGFGSGQKNPTVFEDAFYFDSTEASGGLDYRLSDHFVVGLLGGYSDRRIDFNSQESIVDGQVRGTGESATAYVQFEAGAGYVDGSVGAQHLGLNTVRRITYASNNPLIPSINQTATSDTGADTLMATAATGYAFHYRSVSLEPYLNTLYTHTRIAAFVESNTDGFNVAVGSQTIESLDSSAGLKLQFAFLPRFGVIVPYVYGEYWRHFSGGSRTIESSYAAAPAASTGFNLPTDEIPDHYFVAGGGASVVLPHGFQAYIQYYRVLDYTNYTDHVVTGGMRWEFR